MERIVVDLIKYDLTKTMAAYGNMLHSHVIDSRMLSGRQMAYTLVEGGADTTAALLLGLIVAFLNFPETQKAAQEEMDRVVGDGRLPTIEDISELPYCQAVLNEVCEFVSILNRSHILKRLLGFGPHFQLVFCIWLERN